MSKIVVEYLEDFALFAYLSFAFDEKTFKEIEKRNGAVDLKEVDIFKKINKETDTSLYHADRKCGFYKEEIADIYSDETIVDKEFALLKKIYKECAFYAFKYEHEYCIFVVSGTSLDETIVPYKLNGKNEALDLKTTFPSKENNRVIDRLRQNAFIVAQSRYRIVNNLSEYVLEVKRLRANLLKENFVELASFAENLAIEYEEKLEEETDQKIKKAYHNCFLTLETYKREFENSLSDLLDIYHRKDFKDDLEINKYDDLLSRFMDMLPNIINSMPLGSCGMECFYLPFKKNSHLFYRGVNSPYYNETPKVYRGNHKYFREEHYLYKEFISKFPSDFKNCSPLEILAKMQHYYLPTRLLDVSSNPLVALYMACNGQNDYESVGEVIVYMPMHLGDFTDFTDIDNDLVIALSCLPELTYFEKNNMKQFIDKYKSKNEVINDYLHNKKSLKELEKVDKEELKEFNKNYSKLINICKRYKPDFDDKNFNYESLRANCIVECGAIDERIKAQSGGFILFGLDEHCVKNSTRFGNSNVRIFINNKKQILQDLKDFNIREGTLFPDKEHVALELTKDIR